MIPSEQLAAWLASPEAKAASFARVQRFVDTWSAAPLMAGLETELAYMEPKTPERVIDAARRFIDRLPDIDSLMQALIAGASEDPFFLPPLHGLQSEIHNGLLLFNNADVSIAFGVTGVEQLAAKKAKRSGPASVGFTGVWNLFRYVKAGGATVSFWEAPRITESFTAAEAGQCRMTGRRRIADGEDILVDGSHQSFIVDHASSDIVYFHVMVRTGAAPVTAEYDSDTRTLIGATATDEVASRVQMMATLLRTMERDDAVPVLRELLRSPHFYTRWHLMRELLAMDAEAVEPDLRRMAAEDPHPEVRAAARRTLDAFFADAPAPAPLPQAGAAPCPA